MIDNELIQTFLSVVEYRNMTAAAANLFTTQSNLSKQIKQLEKETGVQLLIRRKGHSEVSLTPAGEEFLKTARKWQEVMKEFDNAVNAENVTEVSIGALDRLNCFTLQDFYRKIMKEHKEIRLDCHTRHSKEIYAMMEAQKLDFGIVSALYPVFNITARIIGQERMYVVCHPDNDYGPLIRPEELDPEKEIYSRWSDEFEVWHDHLWPGRKYRMHVGTSVMAPGYLDEIGRWYLAPESSLHSLKDHYEFTFHTLSVEYPVSKLYLLEQKHVRHEKKEALEIIKNGIIETFR
ncbi:MAG: LysR family transcriptional regulator [Solobacterium sp.]|nr:LysR family transcriptional regulator [Solobacterium sp.]